jgi:SAM-dependent methyltransferase
VALLDWTGRTARPSRCPVCASDREKPVVLKISRYADHTGQDWPDLDLVCCPSCDVRYYDPPVIIEHEAGDLLKFYIEQGAGIDVMLELLALVDKRPVETYLEIGCGFGFSLDYARRILGWQGVGYDPGEIAAAGRDLLDLPIRSAYFDAEAAASRQADVILCSEVIEHIADPVTYLRLLGAALAPGGMLVLSTPNIQAVTPETAPGLMPILSPGGHVVLYTPAALRRLLEDAGFAHIRLTDTGAQIRLAASAVPFSGSGCCYDRARYRDYLAGRAATQAPGSTLQIGYAGRLLKEHVNAADYDGAAAPYSALRHGILAAYGIEIEAPERLALPEPGLFSLIQLGRGWPYNLAGIWYCRGLMLLIGERDPARAVPMFEAACRFGRAVRATLRAFGADDGETVLICKAAELALLKAQVLSRPQAALDAYRRLIDAPLDLETTALAAHLDAARGQLLGDLINRGAFDLVGSICPADQFLAIHPISLADAAGALGYARHLLALDSHDVAGAAILSQVGAVLAPDDDGSALSQSRRQTRRQVLIDLVNLGHLAEAARLEPSLADDQDWPIVNCRAMLDLLHRNDPRRAATGFAHAFALVQGLDTPAIAPAEAARLKHHEVMACLVAGDIAAATAAAGALIGPAAPSWIPAAARLAVEQLLHEHVGAARSRRRWWGRFRA